MVSVSEKTIGDFIITDTIIAKGAFSVLKYGYQKENPSIKVSIKRFRTSDSNESLEKEKIILKTVNHPNIIKLFDFKEEGEFSYIILEYIPNNLSKIMDSKKIIDENTVLKYINQLVQAMKHLNSNKYIHRNIFPSNLLIDENDNLKICSFTFAKKMEDITSKINLNEYDYVGIPGYLAPEILSREKYCYKCDVFSAGVVFFEALFNELPWKGGSVSDYYQNSNNEKLIFPENGNKLKLQTKIILENMLNPNQDKRWDWNQIEENLFEIED